MPEADGRIKHKELSYLVVGCAQKVHRSLGPGFPEAIYHKALCYELTDARIPFDSEKAIEISYEGRLCGQFRPDMIVDGKIILDSKRWPV